MKTISLPSYGIEIKLTEDGGGTISSTVKEKCPRCHRDIPHISCEDAGTKGAKAAWSRSLFNASIDALESLILAHACAGIDVASPAYLEGIETALDAIAKRYE